jgi:hypothetical protein
MKVSTITRPWNSQCGALRPEECEEAPPPGLHQPEQHGPFEDVGGDLAGGGDERNAEIGVREPEAVHEIDRCGEAAGSALQPCVSRFVRIAQVRVGSVAGEAGRCRDLIALRELDPGHQGFPRGRKTLEQERARLGNVHIELLERQDDIDQRSIGIDEPLRLPGQVGFDRQALGSRSSVARPGQLGDRLLPPPDQGQIAGPRLGDSRIQATAETRSRPRRGSSPP